MNNTIARATLIFSAGLILLHAVGFFVPGIFTWGFHFLAYLPPATFIVYVLLASGGLIYVRSNSFERLLARSSAAMQKRPLRFLFAVIGVFVAASWMFRIRVPLLGDSFILIKLFQNTFTGGHAFPASHQPLSLYMFYLCTRLLGTITFPQIMNAFFAAELVLGAGFLVVVFYTVREFFDDAVTRLCVFLFLLALPCMQMFFGYVELYSALLFILALYVLISTLYLHSKIAFMFVPSAFGLLILVHYINILLLPSLVYLGYVEFKRSRFKHIAMSAAIAAVAVALGILLLGEHVQNLKPPPRSTPLLTLAPSPDDIYQAYTLLSGYHVIDLANLLMLLCPAALYLSLLTFMKSRHSFMNSEATRTLFLGMMPVAGFFAIAKFDLPMAQDWDVPASYGYLFGLFAACAASRWLGTESVRVFSTLLVVTLLNSCTYFLLNSSLDPNIVRVRSFIDTRTASHDGCYQSTLHLTEYFVHGHDTANIMEVSEQFIRLFPSDKRGYSNYTLYLQQFGKSMDEKIDGIFDRWLAIDPSNNDARQQYANFNLDIGNRFYHEGLLAQAKARFQRSIGLNPTLPDAHNSLGIVYRKMGNADSALACYRRTVELDPQSVYAYINIGNLYDDLGNSDKAIEWYKKAISVRSNDGTAYYNLGLAYYKQRMFADALLALRQAARLGEADAQAFLQQRGERW